ncbi:MAG: helix-turn-helix domain-containing protein [Oscillospiraceae bacterium]|jgi:transcriptional regulator with XRE-family HTH domain|nr:helix-turn-helix domain-containing protein [Oscillospiraceae bacterium]
MLAEKLKKVRKSRKITQDEVALLLGVKRQTYSAYERGVSVPDSLTLKKLADYFGVTTDCFFTDDDASPQAQNEQEKKLLLIARRAERIPENQRDRLIKSFEENIDIYLDALGLGEDGE